MPRARRRPSLRFNTDPIGTPEYRRALDRFVAKSWPDRFESAASEEDVRKGFEQSLESLLHDTNVLAQGDALVLQSEVKITRGRTAVTETIPSIGRLDSQYRNVIIEYKGPGLLAGASVRLDAEAQVVEDYMLSPDLEGRSVFGFLFDGERIQCYEAHNGEAHEITNLSGPLTSRAVDFLIRCLANYNLREIDGPSLRDDFALLDPSTPTYALFQQVLALKKRSSTQRTALLYSEWEKMFKLSESDNGGSSEIAARRAALGDVAGHTLSTAQAEYEVLFALQTTYSILLKLLAVRVANTLDLGTASLSFADVAPTFRTIGRAREFMARLERGEFYRQMHVLNMVDGDFFAWYVGEEWSRELSSALAEVLVALGRYERLPIRAHYRQQDLFRELYEASIPKEVRHSFGEYYTPYWLAESVLNETITTSNYTLLDPTCGSGTFILASISRVLAELPADMSDADRLAAVLDRVYGFDLNPLAVLGARINYFLNISHLIDGTRPIEIPVYLGDSSYIPDQVLVDNVPCIEYDFFTDVNAGSDFISLCLPESVVRRQDFLLCMDRLEDLITSQEKDKATAYVIGLADPKDDTEIVRSRVADLVAQLVDLESRGLNSIWLRIFANYLKTAVVGPFDYVIGNPPWVDWKVLPEKYRDKLKGRLAKSGLFSRDRNTGGIDLNVCALIANRAAVHFMAKDGTLSFLMPRSVLFNKSYEGFRTFTLDDGTRLYLQRFTDWSKAGECFEGVSLPFCNFEYSARPVQYGAGLDGALVKKKPRVALPAPFAPWERAEGCFERKAQVATAVAVASNNALTVTNTRSEAANLKRLIGTCDYRFRKGVGATPGEAYRLVWHSDVDEKHARFELLTLVRKRLAKSGRTVVLEKEFVRPLILTPDLSPSGTTWGDSYLVFPYKWGSRTPLPYATLVQQAPKVAAFLMSNRQRIQGQSAYNQRIQSTDEFYGLIRVGEYSFGKYFACMRDNNNVLGCVVSNVVTHWGAKVTPLFDGHVSFVSQTDAGFIGEDEAMYVAGVLNMEQTQYYLQASSDSRSIGSSFDIKLPLFDTNNQDHVAFMRLSRSLALLPNTPANESARSDVLKRLWAAYQQI